MGNRESFSVLHVHQDAQWLEGASLLSTDRPTLGVSAHPQLFSKDRLAKCARPYTFSWGPAGTTGQRILVYDHCDYLSKSISNGRFLWRPCHTHIICVQVGERLLLCGDLIIYLALKVIIINDMLTDTSRTAFTAMICMDLHLSKESCWKIVS